MNLYQRELTHNSRKRGRSEVFVSEVEEVKNRLDGTRRNRIQSRLIECKWVGVVRVIHRIERYIVEYFDRSYHLPRSIQIQTTKVQILVEVSFDPSSLRRS